MEHLQSNILGCQHATITLHGDYKTTIFIDTEIIYFASTYKFCVLLHYYSVTMINLLSSVNLQKVPQLEQVVVLYMELSCISLTHSLSCVEGSLSPIQTSYNVNNSF